MKNKNKIVAVLLLTMLLGGMTSYALAPRAGVPAIPAKPQQPVATKPTAPPPSANPPPAAAATKDTAEKPAPTTTVEPPAELPQKQPVPHSSSILAAKDYPQKPYWMLTTPNDPLYPQWYSTKIEAENSWSLGGATTTVAVIDTGVALAHEELSNKWATNAGEQGATTAGGRCWTGTPADKQTNNCDDDNNGYVDDWRGWDFYGNDNDVQTGAVNPTGRGVQHGTMVSGLIGAPGNNGRGIAGVSWSVKILPLQALSDDGSGYTNDIVAAIEYAVDFGVDAINLSLGGPDYDEAMVTAIAYAENHGVAVIAAAGNCASTPTSASCTGLSAPGYMTYPALYPNVISVGATSSTDARASFSSYGPQLDLVAPGADVTYSTSWSAGNPSNAYAGGLNGTSFAAPIVTGTVSMMKAQNRAIAPSEIRRILTETADPVAGMSGQPRTDEYGYGRLNAYKAIMTVKAGPDLLSRYGARAPNHNDAPGVHAAFGTQSVRPLKSSEKVRIYCSTVPGTTCQVDLVNLNTNERRSLTGAKADSSGLAQWLSDPLSAGTWSLTPVTPSFSTSPETITVQ